MNSNSQMYSQLTNSVSTTTLNAIGGGGGGVNQHSASQQQQPQGQQSISPFNGASSEKPSASKNDKSSGLNIFNVDFLTRKNRERKEKKQAAAAAAAAAATNNNNNNTSTSTSTMKSSKFSRGKKAKQNTTVSSSQYENLGYVIF